jgi:hypothetical protein
MRHLKILLWAVFALPHTVYGQRSQLPNTFVDGVVDTQGTTYVLNNRSLSKLSPAGISAQIQLDLDQTIPDLRFKVVAYQAISVDRRDQPAVLWSGLMTNGSIATFVTFINSRKSIRLSLAFGTAISLSISPSSEIYVFGLPRNQSQLFLAHQFSATGDHIRSFHPHISDTVNDYGAFKRLSQSRIVAMADAVYLFSPFLSSIIFEYRNGQLERTHDLCSACGSAIPNLRVLSIFALGESLLAHSIVRDEKGAVVRNEILRVVDGGLYRSVPIGELGGHILGLTPDGKFVYRDVGLGPSRDTIAVR